MTRHVVIGNGVAGTKASGAISMPDPGCSTTLIEYTPEKARRGTDSGQARTLGPERTLG